MPIDVRCDSCGKRYFAPEDMVGKRIKCRQCSATFVIPAPISSPVDPSDADDPLQALAELQGGFGHDSTMMGGSQINLPAPEDEPAVLSGPRYRARFNYPYAAVVDRWLPILLLVGGPTWVATVTFSSDENATPGLCAARLLILLVTYLALIFPMGLAGVKMAAKDLGFSLPRTSTWRALATFMPVFMLGSVLWMISGGQVFGLVLGLLAGFLLSAGTMWLLFHLQPTEVPAAIGYAGGMSALAVAIAAGLLFAMNAMLGSAMTGMHKSDSLAGSPFGEGFNWPRPAKPAIAEKANPKSPKSPLSLTPQVTTTPSPASVPGNESVANAAPKPADVNIESKPGVVAPPSTPTLPPPPATPPPLPTAVESAPITPPPAPSIAPTTSTLIAKNNVTETNPLGDALHEAILPDKATDLTAPATQVTMTPPPASAPDDLLPRDYIIKSLLVDSATLAPIEGPFDRMIRPLTPSDWAVLVRPGSDRKQLDRIWVGAGTPPAGVRPWKTNATVEYAMDALAADRWAISPNGDLLARVTTSPIYGVIIYSIKQKRVLQPMLKFPETGGDADVFGFATDDRLLVHRAKDSKSTLELWDVKSATRLKSFETPLISYDRPPAIRPDGNMLALASLETPPRKTEKVMMLYLYDLATAGEPRKLIVPDLNTSVETTTSGIAFSADGTRLGALFEQGATGLLVAFSTTGPTSGKLLLNQPLMTVPSQPQATFAGSSLLWLSNDALLLYGRSLMSATTGSEAGDLGILSVSSQSFLKPDTCQLNIQTLHGVAVVKLKMEEVEKAVGEK